ncbi:MAG: ribosome maturation factor RimM [Bacteroidales bacterium]
MEKYVLLGRIVRLHSIGGKVTVSTIKSFSGLLHKPYAVFIEIEGKQVPFFIESYECRSNKTLILKFEGYDKPAEVSEFKGCNIYIPVSCMKRQKKSAGPEDLIGFRIISDNRDIAGIISEVSDNQGNILLKVSGDNGAEYLVPFHKDLIVSADIDKKVITMNLPDGLAGINN